jgi:hypothetical protein
VVKSISAQKLLPMNKKSFDETTEHHSQLDAAAILLSLKTTPPSFPKKIGNQLENGKPSEGNVTLKKK